MNEIELIKIKGEQPSAKISNVELEFLINREFPKNSEFIKLKFTEIQSETENGKNRIASAILKLAKSDLNVIDSLVKKANEDFRDIISQAEYPRASKYGFDEPNENKLKTEYLSDWTEYLNWKNILLVILFLKKVKRNKFL